MGHSDLLDATRLCELLCISRSTLRRLLQMGKLPPPLDLMPRKRLWRRSDIEAAINAASPSEEKPPPGDAPDSARAGRRHGHAAVLRRGTKR